MALPSVLSICSGVGMLDLGLRLAVDARTVLYVEREIPAVEVLVARFADGTLHDAPIYSDVTTLDARPWLGVDILAGGIPCQPFSVAGARSGNVDPRALAPHVLRIVGECLPSVVFIENVPPWVLAGHARGFLEGLSDLGYRIAEPFFCRAWDFGAPHKRERVFVMAHREGCDRSLFVQSGRSDEAGRQSDWGGGEVAHPANLGHERSRGARDGRTGSADGRLDLGDAARERRDERRAESAYELAWPPGPQGDWRGIDAGLWPATTEPIVRGVAHGRAARMDRLRALGNGVVPVVVAHAFSALWRRLT